jgi:hypothetical protein
VIVTIVVAVVIVAVMIMIVPVMIIVPVVIVVLMLVMTVILLRPISGLVFSGLHEVNTLVAGVILMTVLVPILCVAGRHVKVDRLHALDTRSSLDNHRLSVDHRRRCRSIGEIHPSVDTGHDLPRDRYADVDITRVCERDTRSDSHGQQSNPSAIVHRIFQILVNPGAYEAICLTLASCWLLQSPCASDRPQKA